MKHLLMVGITSIVTTIGAFASWRIVLIIWEYFKPIKEVTQFCKEKSYNFGVKTRKFLNKRISSDEMRSELIKNLELESETIQSEFIRGLKGA